ncbi:MAG TPA: hypothetical protein VF395_22255, partial [Polyangiaceae bacterium]
MIVCHGNGKFATRSVRPLACLGGSRPEWALGRKLCHRDEALLSLSLLDGRERNRPCGVESGDAIDLGSGQRAAGAHEPVTTGFWAQSLEEGSHSV